MKFGEFCLPDAIGIRLAHTLRLPGRTLRKGQAIGADDIAELRRHGLERVAGARIDEGEYDEDAAAATAGAILAGGGIAPQPAARGRCNLKAAAAGVLCVDAAAIATMNRIDEALTVGTLLPFAAVHAGQVVATVKAIPFAVPLATVAAWRAVGGAPALALAAFAPRRATLIQTTSATTSDKLLAQTAAVTAARLAGLGSVLAEELRCRHDAAAVTDALRRALASGAQLILIAGAAVSKDRADTVPAGLVAAGGEVLHFGMPVEPGNMSLYGRLAQVPVLNLPGCARSRRINGLDWMLQRLVANLPLSGDDIMGMGVGGLLASGAEQGAPEEQDGGGQEPRLAARPPRIAALVLAAGPSISMPGQPAPPRPADGVVMVRRAADAALASRCVQTLVVTGAAAAAMDAALADCPVSLAFAADHAEGMAASLRCGLRALPRDIDGVVVVPADMPRITASHIDLLVDTFDAAAPAIVALEFAGRRGHPVLWPQRYFSDLLQLRGDADAHGLLERHAADVLRVAADDAGVLAGVDGAPDLDRRTAGLP